MALMQVAKSLLSSAEVLAPLAGQGLQLARGMASSGRGKSERKVAVLGAAGGIGQPLSLLMKVAGLVQGWRRSDLATCEERQPRQPRAWAREGRGRA